MHIAYSNAYLTHILHIMQICVDFYIVKWYNSVCQKCILCIIFYLGEIIYENVRKNFKSYACNLLDKHQDTISQIALASGFGSIRSFNRVFRQILGVTPAEYRNEHRKSPNHTVLTT